MEKQEGLGNKILLGVVGILMALFINAAWTTAAEGSKKAQEALMRITALEEQYRFIKDDLGEIKVILRRSIR